MYEQTRKKLLDIIETKMADLKFELRYAYWKLRAIHKHKWTAREEPNYEGKMIEMERTCSLCLKHQTNFLGDWVTTELSYEEVWKRLNEPYEMEKS